ncbi:hypothetical protein D3C72_2045330 [compost metagenome]
MAQGVWPCSFGLQITQRLFQCTDAIEPLQLQSAHEFGGILAVVGGEAHAFECLAAHHLYFVKRYAHGQNSLCGMTAKFQSSANG